MSTKIGIKILTFEKGLRKDEKYDDGDGDWGTG